MGHVSASSTPRTDPYAPMRPRRGAMVAAVLGAVVLGSFLFAAITIPGADSQKGDWGIADRIFIAGLGIVIAWFIWRFATIRALPSRTGIVVRNLFVTRRLEWSEVLRVQFGGGAPWARLDLTDTDTLAVMAIQKADGAYGQALASRLAALVQVHAQGAEPRARFESGRSGSAGDGSPSPGTDSPRSASGPSAQPLTDHDLPHPETRGPDSPGPDSRDPEEPYR